MAVGWVQNWTGVTVASGNLTISGAALTAGNYIAVGVNSLNTDTITINDVAETQVLTDARGSMKLWVFIFKAVGGETSLVIAGATATIYAVAGEFSGIDPTQATAVSTSASTNNASATTCSTGTTGVTTIADAMAVTFLTVNGGTTGHACADASASGGAAYTLGSSAGILLIMAYKALAVAEAEVGTWTWTTSRTSCGAIMTLKGIAAAGGGGTASWSGQDDAPRKRRTW